MMLYSRLTGPTFRGTADSSRGVSNVGYYRMWVIMFLIRVWMFFRHSPVLWRGLGLWRQGLLGLGWISLCFYLFYFLIAALLNLMFIVCILIIF